MKLMIKYGFSSEDYLTIGFTMDEINQERIKRGWTVMDFASHQMYKLVGWPYLECRILMGNKWERLDIPGFENKR